MKRPYRLFTACRGDWHMQFSASYGKQEAAETAAIQKLDKSSGMLPVVDVMVVHADTGEVLFRKKK